MSPGKPRECRWGKTFYNVCYRYDGCVAELVFLGVLATLTLTVAHTTKVRSNIVGTIAIVCNIMMYAAPLSVMRLKVLLIMVAELVFLGVLATLTLTVAHTTKVRPTFIKIVKKGAVEQFSAVPYLATFVNCGIWVLYGLPFVHPHSLLVVTINGTGFFIETVYLILFLFYSAPKQRLKVLLIMVAELVFLGVLATLTFTVAHTTKVRSNIVGSIAIVGNIMMYAAPLSVMKLVITTKSVEYMPFFLSLFSLLNGISWTIYALIRFDPYIVIPNGLGSLLGVTQLILYCTFYKSTQRQLAERKEIAEMNLAEAGQNVGPVPIKKRIVAHNEDV
nr:bidirectional sugar transporter SWEET4-like [Tanacetum cinerariifolium]